ncbi:MAG: hypothetical protein KAI72_09410 [Candidatus Pacebacteria bacterium]|nr:hypothetical protein [Candidatus Paceibacterota bacterium]
MSEWNYIETEAFIRSSENIKISDLVKESIKEWSKQVKRQVTPRNKKVFGSPNNIFEIWAAGIGNPDANKGKSGGYRLLYYLHIAENKLFVDLIETRDNLNFKGSKRKGQKKWDNHVIELRKELLKKHENL